MRGNAGTASRSFGTGVRRTRLWHDFFAGVPEEHGSLVPEQRRRVLHHVRRETGAVRRRRRRKDRGCLQQHPGERRPGPGPRGKFNGSGLEAGSRDAHRRHFRRHFSGQRTKRPGPRLLGNGPPGNGLPMFVGWFRHRRGLCPDVAAGNRSLRFFRAVHLERIRRRPLCPHGPSRCSGVVFTKRSPGPHADRSRLARAAHRLCGFGRSAGSLFFRRTWIGLRARRFPRPRSGAGIRVARSGRVGGPGATGERLRSAPLQRRNVRRHNLCPAQADCRARACPAPAAGGGGPVDGSRHRGHFHQPDPA